MLLPSADREPYADANGITATPLQQARVVPNTARKGQYVVPFTLFSTSATQDVFLISVCIPLKADIVPLRLRGNFDHGA